MIFISFLFTHTIFGLVINQNYLVAVPVVLYTLETLVLVRLVYAVVDGTHAHLVTQPVTQAQPQYAFSVSLVTCSFLPSFFIIFISCSFSCANLESPRTFSKSKADLFEFP